MQQSIASGMLDEIRSRDYRRFLAIARASLRKRSALYALTAFYLELAHIAESVSEPMLAAIRFTWWREGIEAMAGGEVPRAHPIMQALGDVLKDGLVSPDTLCALISARDADMDFTLLDDEAGFLEYLDATSGALHLQWARILGGAIHEEAIIALSRGYSMIRLLRAIPYHARQNQLRLPRSMLELHGLSFMPPSLSEPDGKVQLLTHYLHGKAVLSLSHALPYRKLLPAPHRALLSMGFYDAEALKRVAYDPFHPALQPRSTLGLVWRAITA